MGPTEVVTAQLQALRDNTPLNEGIELTFTFASPRNKAQTGPLDRFVSMVRAEPYDRLLNHVAARSEPIQVVGGIAVQRITVTSVAGEETAFLWFLSRQSGGTYANCWMTDAVIPLKRYTKSRLTRAMMRMPAQAGHQWVLASPIDYRAS